jgi:signal recognition particle subunit SRP54
VFEQLSEKLMNVVAKLGGRGRISEKDLDTTLRELRLVLLEADVHFSVAKDFMVRVREKAIGRQVLESLSPAQTVIKIFHEEMTEVMGGKEQELNLSGTPPVVILLVGLQGAGKTTTAAKLAKFLKEKTKRLPYLVPADVYRPAAIEQLKTLAGQVGIPCFDSQPNMKPQSIAREAMARAGVEGADVVIVDTAGRLAIDDAMMSELSALKDQLKPVEIIFVADVMTGQDAVQTTTSFHERLGLTGVVLTKMDGDARGGAALSIRAVTGVPIKFVGQSEKLAGLEVFYPDRMASRILDMGDVMTLIEKAQENLDTTEAEAMAHKFERGEEFSLEDFRKQLQMIKKLGSIENILKMIPGMGGLTRKLGNMAPPDQEMKRIEAILSSMTAHERRSPKILNGSRRKRIADGSGTTVQDVNRLVKQFQNAQTMMKQFGKMGFKGMKGGGFPFG